MIGSQIQNNDTETLLLKRFNNRDVDAFSEIYLHYYDDLFYFASSLYSNTEVCADDVVQDVFLKLWELGRMNFPSMISLKAYLVISIKNRFKNYLDHRKHIEKHSKMLLLDEEYFITRVVETEFVSLFRSAVALLPEECAKVFTEYMNGLDVKEIAKKLNKSEHTVYKQKDRAIAILKTKLPKDKMLLIMLLLP